MIGKTVATVTERAMMALDTYDDPIYLTETVITFTDGTSVTFLSPDMDLYGVEPVSDDDPPAEGD